MTLIFKIAGAEEWRGADAAGVFAGAPVDRRRLYPFLDRRPGAETAAQWFAGRDDLVLAAIEAEALGPVLRWEPSRGGALFPHLYGRCRFAVRWARPLTLGADGRHDFGRSARDDARSAVWRCRFS